MEMFIIRPSSPPPPVPVKKGPRINDQINSAHIRLIDAESKNHGIVSFAQAMSMAEKAGVDLVEIVPNADPPVCKLLDVGKYKYEIQKKAVEDRKKQKIVEIKEIKLRPGIDEHDYQVKMRSVLKFFEEGDKVKITLRFRGREMVHQDLGMNVINRLCADVDEVSKVVQTPKLEGKQITLVLAPR